MSIVYFLSYLYFQLGGVKLLNVLELQNSVFAQSTNSSLFKTQFAAFFSSRYCLILVFCTHRQNWPRISRLLSL